MSYKKKLLTLLMCVMVLVVCFVMLEVLSRIFINGRDSFAVGKSGLTYHPKFGWINKPGTRLKDPLYGNIDEINAQGFRDEEWEQKLKKGANSSRVFFVGDSNIYGWREDKKNRLSEQFARIALDRGKKVTVFNAGVPGYGTDQEFLVLSEYVDLIRPDYVVIGFAYNDIADSSLPYTYWHGSAENRVYRPYFNLEGSQVANHVVPKRFSYLVRGTIFDDLNFVFLVDKVQMLLDKFLYSYDFDTSQVPPTKLDNLLYEYKNKDVYSKLINKNVKILARMNEICLKNGAQMIVCLLHESYTANYSILTKKLASLKINYIDCASFFKKNPFMRQFSSLWRDSHPSRVGFYVYATQLYNHLYGTSFSPQFSRALWYKDIPSALSLNQSASLDEIKFIFGGWHPPEKEGRWFSRRAGFMLKGKPGISNPRLEIEACAPKNMYPVDVYIRVNNEVCLRTFSKRCRTLSVPVSKSSDEIYFCEIVAKQFDLNKHAVSPKKKPVSLFISKVSITGE